MARSSRLVLSLSALALLAVGCGEAPEGTDEGPRRPGVGTTAESQIAAPSGPLWTSMGTLDVENDYLPRVVAQEIGGVTAEPEAMKAQAVAARTFLARGLSDDKRLGKSIPVDCSQGFQDCSGTASAAVRAAVAATKGQILTYKGQIITANFDAGAKLDTAGVPKSPKSFGYPAATWAGARQEVKAILDQGGQLYGNNGAVIRVLGSGGDPVAWTELYCTNNEGKTGNDVTPTLQSYGAKANRGALSQWGAVSLAERGRDYRSILRTYYGADIEIGGVAGTNGTGSGNDTGSGNGSGSGAGNDTGNNTGNGGKTPASVSCATDQDCHHGAMGIGVVCANTGADANTCVDGCHADADCDQSEVCDRNAKPRWVCTAAWPVVGTTCQTDEECGGEASGRVCANSGVAAGTCIVGCHGDTSCPSGSTCDKKGTPWICVGSGQTAPPSSPPDAPPPPAVGSAPKNVPYECQYSNGIDEGGAVGGNTCATTSTSMALRYFGIPLTAKQYFDAYRKLGYTYEDAKSFALIPQILSEIPQTKGRFQTRTLVSGQGGTTADLKKALDEGFLVVVGANLFQGHVLLVTGYDDKGVYVNDPAGVWHPSLGNTGDAYDRCYQASNNAKGDLISWASYKSRNVFCGENAAVHLCPAKADLWMMAIKLK